MASSVNCENAQTGFPRSGLIRFGSNPNFFNGPLCWFFELFGFGPIGWGNEEEVKTKSDL